MQKLKTRTQQGLINLLKNFPNRTKLRSQTKTSSFSLLAVQVYAFGVLKNPFRAITAKEFAGDGVDAKWIVYGKVLGDQKVSILRLSLAPGAKTTFSPECPALFHTNGGSGRIGKLEVKYHQNMVLGEVYPEIGFITQSALANGGVEIENTGAEPLVLTFDFPQNAHSKIPGISS